MISIDKAQGILNNVLSANAMEACDVPLTKLSSYSEYRRERFSLQKFIIVIVLILFCILPLFFIPPRFSVLKSEVADNAVYPSYLIKVTSSFPVSSVTAKLNGKSVAVLEKGERTYSVTPTANGDMIVTVRLINGQYNSSTEPIVIEDIDAEAPVMISSMKRGETIIVTLVDEGLGVDWAGIYAVDLEGNKILPVETHPESGFAVFPYADLDIYAPDLKGNVLHLVLTTEYA